MTTRQLTPASIKINKFCKRRVECICSGAYEYFRSYAYGPDRMGIDLYGSSVWYGFFVLIRANDAN